MTTPETRCECGHVHSMNGECYFCGCEDFRPAPSSTGAATEKNPMEPKRTRRELHDTGAAADAWDRLDYLRQRYAADPVVLGILASVAALRSEVARLRSSPVSAADGALREAASEILGAYDRGYVRAHSNHAQRAFKALCAALSRVPSSVAASGQQEQVQEQGWTKNGQQQAPEPSRDAECEAEMLGLAGLGFEALALYERWVEEQIRDG